MMKRCAILSLMFSFVSLNAYAGMIGLTGVVVDYRYPNMFGSLGSATVDVGAGVEISCPTGPFSLCSPLAAYTSTIDIGDWTIRYDYSGESGSFSPGFVAGEFSGLVFANLDIGGSGIQSVVLATNFTGLDSSRVSFTSNSVAVNLQNLDLAPDNYFELTVGDSTGVPEPGSCILLGTGLLGLLLLIPRRRA